MARAARMLSSPPVFIYGQSFLVKTTETSKLDAVKEFTEELKKLIFEDPAVVEKVKPLLEKYGITSFETEAFNITHLEQSVPVEGKPTKLFVQQVKV